MNIRTYDRVRIRFGTSHAFKISKTFISTSVDNIFVNKLKNSPPHLCEIHKSRLNQNICSHFPIFYYNPARSNFLTKIKFIGHATRYRFLSENQLNIIKSHGARCTICTVCVCRFFIFPIFSSFVFLFWKIYTNTISNYKSFHYFKRETAVPNMCEIRIVVILILCLIKYAIILSLKIDTNEWIKMKMKIHPPLSLSLSIFTFCTLCRVHSRLGGWLAWIRTT